MSFLYSFCQLLRIVLAPFLALLAQMTPLLKERWIFEQKNKTDQSGFFKSFSSDALVADRTYQVSSEGEWEQLWPFVVADLNDHLRVELIYTSASLEKRVQLAMSSCQLKQIRFLRLPVLTYFPVVYGPWQNIDHWCTANELVLCRYDFYPELMMRGKKMKRFILLSASLKSKQDLLQREGTVHYLFYQKQYQLFHRLLLASHKERERFSQLGISVKKWVYEARGLQIALRLKNSRATLSSRQVDKLISCLETRSPERRLIFGSAWPEDLKSLDSLSPLERSKIDVVVAPHVLDEMKIKKMQSQMGSSYQHFIFNGEQSEQEILAALQRGCLLWVVVPALLLELYTFFPFVFVGGGFGRSVHSVLEPYLAGAFIFCGPKVHRSTEVELVLDDPSDRLVVLQQAKDFAASWSSINRSSLAAPKNISYYENIFEKERESFHQARLFFLGHFTGEQ